MVHCNDFNRVKTEECRLPLAAAACHLQTISKEPGCYLLMAARRVYFINDTLAINVRNTGRKLDFHVQTYRIVNMS